MTWFLVKQEIRPIAWFLVKQEICLIAWCLVKAIDVSSWRSA